VKPAPFDYVRAGTVAEAVQVLAEAEGDGKVLAGGQSLVPVLALRMGRPSVLVDVNRLPGLDSVTADEDSVRIGALVRHRALAEQQRHPLLAAAARWIGHAAIRSRGTAGGSIAHADPSAELPVVAVGCGASVQVAGVTATRTVPAEELFVAPLMTTLADDEIVTGLAVPVPERWGFAEFARRHGDFALVLAVVAETEGRVRIAVGGVAGVPVRAVAGEEVLAGGGSAEDAAAAAAAALEPTADLHGSAPFRRALAAEMIRRALAQARIGQQGRAG
jgi:aerobic carbon-monoxide dehydrogenase medium subunit